MTRPSRLHNDLADQILQMIRKDGLGQGAWLNENSFARSLDVSRTPIRAAFSVLAERGVVRRHLNKGLELVFLPDEEPEAMQPHGNIEAALVQIAHDREERVLPDNITEVEVMRRYDLSRPEVQKVLSRLADLDMIERKPGQGWRFLHEPRDSNAHLERYRFRMIIEPAAILQPGFELDRYWAEDVRKRHEAFMGEPWRDSLAVAFYEMNAEFHEGLAAASGNRYLLSAVKRQNELRRLSNYDWTFGFERVHINCGEHLQILESIQRGDLEIASMLMRRHLEKASTLRSSKKSEEPRVDIGD